MKSIIRELRKARRMTQVELAYLVGTTRATIIGIEKGKYNPSLIFAVRIAKVFGLTLEEIFDFSEVTINELPLSRKLPYEPDEE